MWVTHNDLCHRNGRQATRGDDCAGTGRVESGRTNLIRRPIQQWIASRSIVLAVAEMAVRRLVELACRCRDTLREICEAAGDGPESGHGAPSDGLLLFEQPAQDHAELPVVQVQRIEM